MNGETGSVPKESGLPPNVTEFRDRHGKWHLRFRKKGFPTYYFEGKPGTDLFRKEYAECVKGGEAVAAQRREAKIAKIKPGSLSALIATYYGVTEFTGLAKSTQTTYRGILERFRTEYGDLQVRTLTRQHVKDILGGMADTPSAANNLRDRLRALMTFAMDAGWRDDDPTFRVKAFKIRSDGFHTWDEKEIGRFENRHPTGTKPRLALALMLYTSQRRSDAVLLGRQRIAGNRINVRQKKTGEWVSVPIHHKLRLELNAAPKGNLTFLLTEYGKPFTAAGFGNWFRTQCDLAGLPQCSAHGLRKASARRLAEAGCTHEEIKSITGHRTDKEVSRYVEAANRQGLSERAINKIGGSKRERKKAASG